MIPLPYFALAVVAALLVGSFGGFKVGGDLKQGEWDAAELTRAEKVIVRQEVVIKEVPKIVTKVVTREVEVTKEVERVVTKINDLVTPDCVLPDGVGLSLVAAANGLDPEAPGVVDEIAGRYDCRETLTAVLSDLRAGWVNTSRLAGLQDWAKVVTEAKSE